MKRNRNPAILAAVAVFSIALLSGCRELPGKEAADKQLEQRLNGNFQKETSEEVKQGLDEVTSGIKQTVQNTSVKMTEDLNGSSLNKVLEISKKTNYATELVLKNNVGEVKVTSGNNDFITVKATVVPHSGMSLLTKQNIIDHAKVTVQADGNKLKVFTHSKNAPAEDLWTWAQKEYGSSDFSISYNIQVPSDIDEYQISNNVGSIQLQNLKGTFHISSNVGSIVLDNAQLSGSSTVVSNTGSIDMHINALNSSSTLKASSEIGTITANLNSRLKCTVTTKSELGQITGNESGKTDFNGGGPLISLYTQIGSITVQ
ncbi:hypothetical protein [Paenibacillus sp. sgz5001063]|uniref:hypothetical protein n=1 Tax=Paenibacillus sp. sgz5001063 TaxID=3242474 RepID=UPI0036D363E7